MNTYLLVGYRMNPHLHSLGIQVANRYTTQLLERHKNDTAFCMEGNRMEAKEANGSCSRPGI